MNDWNNEEEGPRRFSKKINKEVYCKKNKLGNGRYGFHTYVGGRCTLCNKIEPCLKSRYRNGDIDNEYVS